MTVLWSPYIGDLAQECSNATALAMAILQSCTKPSTCLVIENCETNPFQSGTQIACYTQWNDRVSVKLGVTKMTTYQTIDKIVKATRVIILTICLWFVYWYIMLTSQVCSHSSCKTTHRVSICQNYVVRQLIQVTTPLFFLLYSITFFSF